MRLNQFDPRSIRVRRGGGGGGGSNMGGAGGLGCGGMEGTVSSAASCYMKARQ